METAFYSTVNSPVGPLTVCCTGKGLLRLDRGTAPPTDRAASRFEWVESAKGTQQAVRELKEYFAGRRREFTVTLDLRGTRFQVRVWKALQTIPYGQTRSYRDIARQVGRPLAYRAVGQANHRNPVSIIVPCHRVVAADGTLGGYGGGLGMKRFLLELEGAGMGEQTCVACRARAGQ